MQSRLLQFFALKKPFLGMIAFLLLTGNVIAQTDFTLSGKVTDGEAPLPNVSIMVTETRQGTTTDDNGEFSLRVSTGQTLVISHTGFETQTLKVGSAQKINIILTASAGNTLNDVVVIGYGTRKKTSLTAAVSTLKGKEIAFVPLTNLSNGLGGRVSGVI